MSEYTIGTRRSRSKTPHVRSSVHQESGEHAELAQQPKKKKKTAAPDVQTIVEEVIEVTSSSSPNKQSSTQAATKQFESKQVSRIKTKTSDYSSEDISPENKRVRTHAPAIVGLGTGQSSTSTATATSSTTTTSGTTVVTKSKRWNSGAFGESVASAGAAATSTPKGNQQQRTESFAESFVDHADRNESQHYTELSQNALNSRREHKTSLSRVFGDSFDMATADLSNHLPYIEYKETGEYWNKTPKTDYTYSEFSPHRRLLAPGVVAMPNMSRKSLQNYESRAHLMQNYEEKCVRRQYYQTEREDKYTANRLATERLLYDSGDEMDHANYRSQTQYYNGGKPDMAATNRSWFMRIITTIITTITSTFSSSDRGGGAAHTKRKTSNVYMTPGTVQRGFFGTIMHSISSKVTGLFRYIGMGILSVLTADAWLLQSQNGDNRRKKRFLLLLLLLLPLLLLVAAGYFLPEGERVAYVQRAQALLPFSVLGSLRAAGNSLHGALLLPIAWLDRAYTWSAQSLSFMPAPSIVPTPTHTHIHVEQLQRALSAEEYEQLLQHVNGYVQQMVDLKLQQQQQRLSPEQMQVIVRVMRENLEQHTREKRDTFNVDALSEADLQRLASRVQEQLLVVTRDWQTGSAGTPPPRLSAEQLAEIRALLVEHESTHNHAYYTLLTQQLDLDALLLRILSSPQLAQYIDARVASVVDGLKLQRSSSGDGLPHTDLHGELAFIKLALSDKQSENADLQQSILRLEDSQADLLQRLQAHELATEQRFSTLLVDIERKLAALHDDNFAQLNQQVRLALIEILGFKQATASGAQLQDADLQQWVSNMFVAKDYLEQRLLALNNRTNDRVRDEIDRSAVVLMRDINARLKREILLVVEARQNESVAKLKGHISAALSEEEVRRIVKSVLAIYDADKTGLVDFALESAGGQILSTRCTESYQTKTAQLSIFGIPLWYPTNTPRVAISPNVQPGECWAFQGFPGFLVLRLNSLVYVTGFTLEHIPKSLSPNGRIDSAPGNFTVWGLEHEKDYEPVQFGAYEYENNDATLQYFPVQNENIKRPYDIVELRIESNHGHPQYTCLYRFRVHGKPPAA